MTETTTPPRDDEAPQTPPSREPRLPAIPGPVETAGLIWRRLRKMSTALLLLFGLAAASIIATFIPQEPLIPTTVEAWRTGEEGPGELAAAVFDAFGFFDLYGTWWFAALIALLLVSLAGCLTPRWRVFLRNVRRRPAAGRNLEQLTHTCTFDTGLDPLAALAAGERVLRRRRFRRRRIETPEGRPQLAAERGHWREGGSLVFHSAFFLLVGAAIYAHSTGFVGQINLPEGRSFADTRISYDLAEPGRFFDITDHRGFVVTLDDFTVDYYDNFAPSEFVSTITIAEDGEPVRSEEVRVNHPVTHDGMRIYQARFGMAPRVAVRSGEHVLFDDPVMLSEQEQSGIFTGAAKIVVGDQTAEDPPPQVALELVFLPDAAMSDDGQPFSQSPEPNNPRLVALLHVGELGLERNVPVSQADLSEQTVAGPPAILPEGEADTMAGGALDVEFVELSMWSGFQVSHPPGRWVLLSAAGLILLGLVPSMYSFRRRVWVEAQPTTVGSRVRLAGVALQRKPAFADEFTQIADRLRGELPSVVDGERDPQDRSSPAAASSKGDGTR